MDDIFYFTWNHVSLAEVARVARMMGWVRVNVTERGMEARYDERQVTLCHWSVFDIGDADPEEEAQLRAEGLVGGFCISHHRGNSALLALLRVLLETWGGLVGNDSESFCPRFDASNIDHFRYADCN